jgi:diguanylate cyclase (GGDEF)-like protein/PAS domain S-box-containing protein
LSLPLYPSSEFGIGVVCATLLLSSLCGWQPLPRWLFDSLAAICLVIPLSQVFFSVGAASQLLFQLSAFVNLMMAVIAVVAFLNNLGPVCRIRESKRLGAEWFVPLISVTVLIGGFALFRQTSLSAFVPLMIDMLLVISVIQLARISYWVQLQRHSQLREMEEKQQWAESRLGLVWDSAQAAVMVFDERWRVIESNQGAVKMFGWDQDEMLGMELEQFIPVRMRQRHQEFLHGFAHSEKKLHHNLDDPKRFMALTKSGGEVPFIATVTKQDVAGERIYGALLIQADQLASKLDRLQEKAAKDSLTQTENRHSLDVRIQQIEQFGIRKSVSRLGCIMLDIDHFKQVNDNFGHSAGDAVLAEFASRVRSCLRAGDILYRYGGEEFLALVTCSCREEVAAIADRILDEMRSASIDIEGHRLEIRCSMGLSVVGQNTKSVTECIRMADEALYRAKDAGRDQYVMSDRGVRSVI